jgi:methyltransferase (TIGR00027 family)
MFQSDEVTVTVEWDIPSGVGVTALAVAEMRARSNLLVEDRFASSFVEAAGRSMDIDEATWDYWSQYLAVRTRFYDDYLSTNMKQVVLLGAGLDARAFRLSWPDGCTLYEIDQPKVLQFKQEVLDRLGDRPMCERVPVACDLRFDWTETLRSNGFDATLPTAWLAEGLLPYLPAEAESTLFHRMVALSAPGSMIAFDLPPDNDPRTMTTSPAFRALMDGLRVELGQEWQTDVRADCVESLRNRGWRVDGETFATTASRYGCPLPSDPVVGQGTLLVAHLVSRTTSDRDVPAEICGTSA